VGKRFFGGRREKVREREICKRKRFLDESRLLIRDFEEKRR
jgi:hypothetical protein